MKKIIKESDFKPNFDKWILETGLIGKKDTIIIQLHKPLFHTSYEDWKTEVPENNYIDKELKEFIDIDELENYMEQIFETELLNNHTEDIDEYNLFKEVFNDNYNDWKKQWTEQKVKEYESEYER